MEIETEKLKETITVLFDNLRAMDTEIQAHKLAIHFLKEGGLIDATIPWEETLDASRQNPVLLQKIADKYNLLTADLLQSIDRAQPDQVIAELLRKWKPSGPIN
jgi:hypothetical protein